jgi:thioredoxin 1
VDPGSFLFCAAQFQLHQIMAHESIVNLTSDNFAAEAEGASAPVVIDFWSEHCGPCKMLAPVLDEVAAEIGDAGKVTKVDVMAERELAMKFGIRAVPTLIFMKDGEVRETKTGIMMKDAIIEKLNSLA